jgi:alpha-1,3-rhamnosyl/mannosyltransferase
MRILVEATELATAEKAGVYTARLGLVGGMLEHLAPHDELILTSWPVGELPPLPEPAAGQRSFLRGPRRGTYFPSRLDEARESRWPMPVRLGLVTCGMVENIGRKLIRPLQTRQFARRAARGGPIDVFLSSEMDYYRFPTGVTVAFLHDLLPLLRPEWFTAANRRNYLRKLRHVRQDCDLVLTNSECTRQDAIKHLGMDPSRFFVTPLAPRPHFRRPLPGERWDDLDARWGLAGRRAVLYVGTVEPRKNLARLMQAVERLTRDRRFHDVCLVLCGSVGWHCDDVLAQAAALERAGHLVRTGFADDQLLSRLYRRADVFACVSLYEGFGLPVLEAMQSGTPVLSSTGGALAEVVAGSALTVDPLSVDHIEGGLRQLLDDVALRGHYRRAGPQRAAQFSWSATGRRVLDVFRWATGQGVQPANSVECLTTHDAALAAASRCAGRPARRRVAA